MCREEEIRERGMEIVKTLSKINKAWNTLVTKLSTKSFSEELSETWAFFFGGLQSIGLNSLFNKL